MPIFLNNFGFTGASAGGGGTLTGANNGLSVSGTTVQLGGILNQNTTIDFSVFALAFNNFVSDNNNKYLLALNSIGEIETFDASAGGAANILQEYLGDYYQLQLIQDSSYITSVDYISRNLPDASGNNSVDWANRLLYSFNVSSVVSVDWANRELKDSTGVTSVDWANRTLYDSTDTEIVNWATASSSGLILKNIGSAFSVILQNDLLTANRTYDFPDSSGTLTVNGFMQGGNSFGALATLGTNDAFGLAFETSDTERARFLSTGEFGIGTISPVATLHVVGDVKINSDDGTDATLSVVQLSGTTNILNVWSAGFGKQIIRSSDSGGAGFVRLGDGLGITMDLYTQNTGLGQSAGTHKLSVKGSSVSIAAFTPVSGSGFIELFSDGSNNPIFYMGDAASTPRVNILTSGDSYFNGGNVGFGLTASITGWVSIGAGTTTKPSILLTTGTLMTTASVGAFEYASTRLYFTPYTSGNRHQVKTKRSITFTSGASTTLTVDDELCVVNKGTGSATTVNLPASPSDNDECTIADGKGDAATNNITVGRNGENIEGAATDVVMSVNYQSLTFRFISGYGWKII